VGPDEVHGTWVTFAAVSDRYRAKTFAETCEMNVQIWYVERREDGKQVLERHLEDVDNDATSATLRAKRVAELESVIAKAEEELIKASEELALVKTKRHKVHPK
jgi:hypothetical protein